MQEMHFGAGVPTPQPAKQPLVQFSRDSICVSRKMLLTVGVLVGVFALGMLVSSGINNASKGKVVTKSRAEGIEIIGEERFPVERGWINDDMRVTPIYSEIAAEKVKGGGTYQPTRIETWMLDEKNFFSKYNGEFHMKYGVDNMPVPTIDTGQFNYSQCHANLIFDDPDSLVTQTCAAHTFSIAYTNNDTYGDRFLTTAPDNLYINVFNRVPKTHPNDDEKGSKYGILFFGEWKSFKLPKNEIRLLTIPNSQIEKDIKYNLSTVQVTLSTVPFGELTD